MSEKKVSKREKRKIAYALMLVTQIGISMLVPIFLCTFLGIWIMKYINNSLVVLFAVIFGFVVAFRNVYILVRSMYIEDKEKEDAEYEYYKKMEEERNKRLGR